MAITLKPEHERLIAQAIESGAYQTADDVIAHALAVLQAEDEWLLEHKSEIVEKIDRGLSQLERGDVYSPEQARAELQKRKTEWLRNQNRG